MQSFTITSPCFINFEVLKIDNPHHNRVTWRDQGRSVIRHNTFEECFAQIIGLGKILGGSAAVEVPSDHHVFNFNNKAEIVCHTADHMTDTILIPPAYIPAWLAGYCWCVWNYSHPLRERELEGLFEVGVTITRIVGKEPPFVAYAERYKNRDKIIEHVPFKKRWFQWPSTR